MNIDERIDKFVTTLPETPKGLVYIVLYNVEFASKIHDRIKWIKGPAYLNKVVYAGENVLHPNQTPKENIYLMPNLYDYHGNGYN